MSGPRAQRDRRDPRGKTLRPPPHPIRQTANASIPHRTSREDSLPFMAKLLRRTPLLLTALLSASAAAFAQPAATPIQITADLSEGARHLYHAELEIPVKPGPLALITPKWIPGNHRPTGPVDDITGVVFTANRQGLPWPRDN